MVGKEFLEQLNISNIFFKTFTGITSILTIVSFTETQLTVYTDNELTDKGKLTIDILDKKTLKKERIELFVTTIKDYSMNNTFTLFLEDALPEDFTIKLINLNNIFKKSNNRKDIRYNVGLKNWKQFGLLKPDLFFICGTSKVKCIISNASIHGALLTGERSLVQIGNKVDLICYFEEKPIILKAILISAESIKSNFFKYSIRFLEPLSLSWCNHIIEYGESLENMIW